MSFGAVASAGDPLRRGLVGWYRMLGNANDSSGRGNTGTLVASPTTTTDKYGNTNAAYTFNGSTQYISLTQSSGLPLYSTTAPFSICMWVRGVAQGGIYLYAEGSSAGGNTLFGFTTDATGAKLRIFIRTSGNSIRSDKSTTTTVLDNSWHHIAYTDNLGTARVYVDGVQDATSFSYTPSSLGTVDRCTVAALVRAAVQSYFSGSLFDVRLYTRALTADEVGTLFRATQRI